MYDALGYTWVSNDPWAGCPITTAAGPTGKPRWVWAPPLSTVFSQGSVLDARRGTGRLGTAGTGRIVAASGPKGTQPQQYSNAYTAYAAFQQDARTVDPAGFTARPKDPLAALAFTARFRLRHSWRAARRGAARPACGQHTAGAGDTGRDLPG